MCGKKVAFAALVVLGAVAFTACEGPLTPEARQLLQRGYDLYGSGNNAAVIETLDVFLQQNPNSARNDEVYYLRGMARYRLNDPGGARDDLNLGLAETSNKELRANARVALGDLAYAEGEMTMAESFYRQALPDIEQGEKPSDHAHYRLGCVLQRQGRWEDADLQFDRVIYLFADSQLGKLAARRVRSTAWTIQTGAFESRTRADLAVKQLIEQELPAVSKVILFDAKPVFVVHVGRFATYEQATTALPDTRKHSGDAFVTTTR
ncbi:MAG: SPOR domain-containing protein [Planctomycetota bacterium]|jgi:tetratricopeptide (TPR) repeat protein